MFHLLLMRYSLLLIVLVAFTLPAHAQTGTLTGIISDAEDRLVLPGANIYIKAADLYTTSDRNGFYVLKGVPAGPHTLQVSYLGYEAFEQRVTVQASKVTTVDVVLQPSVLMGDEVVVIGDRLKGQAKALNQQLTGSNVTNIVSADQIGRFPDGNAGDALKRIPGIVVQNDQGEARFGLIRGTAPRFNSLMINGERMPSTEGERRDLSLDLIPADLLQTIEVNKTLTPEMDGDAIGGSVNLVTRAAPYGTRVSATLGSGYNFLSEEPTGLASLIVGTRAMDNRLGIIVSGSYFNHRLGSDNVEFEWDQDGGQDFLVDHQIRKYDVQRIRYGTSAAFDYQLAPGSVVTLRGTYNLRDDFENRFRLRYRLDSGENDGIPGADGVVREARVERQIKGGGPGVNDGKRLERSITATTSLGGEHLIGTKLRMEWKGAWAYARESRPDEFYANFRFDDVDLRPDISNRDAVGVAFVTPENVGGYELQEFEVEQRFNEEIDYNGKLNFELPLITAGPQRNRLKFGARYKNKTKRRTNDFDIYETTDDRTLTDFATEDQTDADYLAGDYAVGLFPTKDALANFQSTFSLETNDAPEEYEGANFEATEQVVAGYVQLEQQLSEQLSFIGGVRLESTSLDYAGNELLFNEDGDLETVTPRSDRDDYLNVLPSLNVRFQVDPNTVLRAAATQSIARPNYYDLVPYRIVNTEDNELEEGNPALEPTRSLNLDLSAERYFTSVGIVSAGVFYKSIEDFIYEFAEDDYVDPLSGDTFDEYTQPRNGNGAALFGAELAIQRQLDFLPGALSGLGVYFNYTFTDSDVEALPDRDEDIPELPGTSRNSFNASLSYEMGGFSARASVNYHDSHIDEVGGSTFDDIYYMYATHIDVNAAYEFRQGIRVFFEANNLTNQPLRYYQGARSRLIQSEYYSTRFNLGVKYDF
ncbi:MAG: TonB-dependent receptor [Rhodothermales bacterium]